VAATGEGFVISVNGCPTAELRPFVPMPTPGRFEDSIRFSDGAFAPLSPEEADELGA
jgi:hypothetical protein